MISFCCLGPSALLPSRPFRGANLRRLHLHRLCTSFVPHNTPGDSPHLSSSCLASILLLFVRECPRLEALAVVHGRKYTSRGEQLPPLPSIGGTLCHASLPRGLVMLHLGDIVVQPEDVAAVSLPQLALVRLVHCGPAAPAAAQALAANCPKLTEAGCVVLADRDCPKIADDAPARERKRATFMRYPTEDLTGLSFDGVIDVLERGYLRTF